MGSCFLCSCTEKKNSCYNNQKERNDLNTISIDVTNIIININREESIMEEKWTNKKENLLIKKRDEFIDDFFSKNNELKPLDKINSIFITNLDKKMKISSDSIIVEENLILKANLVDPNNYYDSFWMILDRKNDDFISKEIFIDEIKVDSSKFEVKDYSIKLELIKKLKINLIIIILNILFYKIKVLQQNF